MTTTVPVSVERIKAWIAYLKQFGIDTSDMESWIEAKAPRPTSVTRKSKKIVKSGPCKICGSYGCTGGWSCPGAF